MADGSITIRQGAMEPVEGDYYVASGVIQIQDGTSSPPQPAPVATIYDYTGAVVAGFSNLSVTYYDTAHLSEVKVQYMLDTSNPIFQQGYTYTVVFTAYIVYTDTNGVIGGVQRELCSVDVYIAAPTC